MKRRSPLPFLPLLLAIPSAPLTAQPAAGGPAAPVPATLDAGARQAIVAKLGEALRRRYVFPDVGAQAAAKIEAARAAGDYDQLTDPGAFAARLAADANSIAHDKHLRVSATGGAPMPPPGGMRMPSAESGIVRADRLAGGIGYIEVVGFPAPDPFRPVLDRAMASLDGSRALIIDVRRNVGGTAAAAAYLLSYLVAPDLPLNEIVSRVENTDDFTRSGLRSVSTPISFAGVPVYILTSSATFSAGEAFTYDAQALKRATVIGEVTGGGANPIMPVELGGGFSATIPFARAENAVTKTNWEGRGIQPDVPVPAADALAAALERAGQKPVRDIAAASVQQLFAPRSVPRPGSEAALRTLLTGVMSGKPDFGAMAPEFADMTRQLLPDLQAQLAPLGALKSLSFHGADMMGGDEFDLHFESGVRRMALILRPDGKMLAMSAMIPVPAGQ